MRVHVTRLLQVLSEYVPSSRRTPDILIGGVGGGELRRAMSSSCVGGQGWPEPSERLLSEGQSLKVLNPLRQEATVQILLACHNA